MRTFYIQTFGCQMNEHDSQKMEALLRAEGYAKTTALQEADVVVINTCSIREKPYHKAMSAIGKARKGKMALVKDPAQKPVIAVTGCVASHDGEYILKHFPYVDIAIGPDHVGALPQLVRDAEEKKRRSVRTEFYDLADYEFPTSILPSDVSESKSKAYVTIMKGCDNACSFCIVPFTRGKEVSRMPGDIVDEIQRLETQGVKEITLLGQNVNSYGKRLPVKTDFAKLLRQIDEETSIRRIRYTSPHPKDLSKELIEEYARNLKLCPQIHLPIQSGSNRLLKLMRRSYTRDTYLRRVEALRKACPEIAISTDIIVGFPGETEKDFQATLDVLREVRYYNSYSFAFSPRPRTEAMNFLDDVPEDVKKDRLKILQDLQREISYELNQSRVGRVEEVLVENEAMESRNSGVFGRTAQGILMNFPGDASLVGAIVKAEVLEATAFVLKGRISP